MSAIVGIIGYGYVGRATAHMCKSEIVYINDINPSIEDTPITPMSDLVNNANIIFICVPTPMRLDKSCDTSIVDSVINQVRELKNHANIVVRSTVPIGFCKSRGVSFFPEFLTERNWLMDVISCTNWLLGTNDMYIANTIQRILTRAVEFESIHFDNLRVGTPNEIEMVKYVRNAFLATKVAFFNEVEMFCTHENLDWDAIRRMIILDSRIGESHTCVPGHGGTFGFGGTCLPKDTASLMYQMEKCGVEPVLLRSVMDRNTRIDRNRST